MSASARASGVGRRTHYHWLEDEDYASRFADATEDAVERLEAEADRRAVKGVDEPVHYKGERVDVIKRYSDNLLMFRLKALRPEKYREHYDHTLSGPGGGPLVVRWQTEAEAQA